VTSEPRPAYGRSKLPNDALNKPKIEPVLGTICGEPVVSDTSSVSGPELFPMGRENERDVNPMPSSKYEEKGI
jgi:hypothetical protein